MVIRMAFLLAFLVGSVGLGKGPQAQSIICKGKTAQEKVRLVVIKTQDSGNSEYTTHQVENDRAKPPFESDDLLEAEVCYGGEELRQELGELAEVLRANLTDIENIEGICLFPSTNEGSGYGAVIRKFGPKDFKVEWKWIDVVTPVKKPGVRLSCQGCSTPIKK